MKKNMRQWVQDILHSDERKAFPLMAGTGLELMNLRIGDVLRDGMKQASCIKALASRYPSAASVTIMDLSVEAEAFGSDTCYFDNEIPAITGKIVTGMESAQALEIPSIGGGRTGVCLEAAALSAGGITDRPVFGCHIGPFSLAGRLCGMTETLLSVHTEPEMLHVVLGKCVDFLVKYTRAFRNAGANGIVIAEPAAGIISPLQCDEFSSRYVKRIVEDVQDEDFMVILHNCGATRHHVASMAATGAMGLHFGNAVDMKDVLPQIPSRVIALGNLDPAGLLKGGRAEEVREKSGDLLRDMAAYKNFILSSGCDIPPGTPPRNIDAFFEALRDYNGNTISGIGAGGVH